MLCPECNHKLLPISIKSTIGNLVFEYCGECGGVWTNQGDINFVKEKELELLRHMLPESPTHPYIRYNLCPKDRTTLDLYKGESVPTGLDILRCSRCSGIFFPNNSLFEFKKAQEAKLNYFKVWNIPLHSIYAILLPMLLIVVIGGGLLASLQVFNTSTDFRSRAKDVMSKPTVLSQSPTETLISFTTSQSAKSHIKYWIREDVIIESEISSTPKETHLIVLKDLKPGTTYFYQIYLETGEGSNPSTLYQFMTPSL